MRDSHCQEDGNRPPFRRFVHSRNWGNLSMQKRLSRRWFAAVAGAAAAAGMLIPVTGAWAPHVAQLQVTPTTFKAGDTVTVFGPSGYGATNPVEIRVDSADGPVIGTCRT